mmetsp:Transcript_9105/g.28847  ORF Transcript_9105/g.28847 Transcript_9105/m.28847 type:complete len:281 (+) Transcript_9105:58-900(+)
MLALACRRGPSCARARLQPRRTPGQLAISARRAPLPPAGRGLAGRLAADADAPDADVPVGVAGEEGGAVGRPAERDAVVRRRLLAHGGEVGLELVDDGLGLEVPDLDARRRRRAQPVPVRREDHRVDDVPRDERVEVLALVQVPEHGGAVLAARGAEGAVGRDGDRVEVPRVPHQVGAQLAVREVPHLDQLVPAARHDQRVGGRRREADARDPLGVAVLGDGVLALAERVPQLDRLVARARHDLPVVRREGDREDVLLVRDKPAGRGARVEVPEAEGAVP